MSRKANRAADQDERDWRKQQEQKKQREVAEALEGRLAKIEADIQWLKDRIMILGGGVEAEQLLPHRDGDWSG